MNEFLLPYSINPNITPILAHHFMQLDMSRPLVLDASETETITKQGLQMIIMLAKRLENAGGTLDIRGLKPVFEPVFQSVGFQVR